MQDREYWLCSTSKNRKAFEAAIRQLFVSIGLEATLRLCYNSLKRCVLTLLFLLEKVESSFQPLVCASNGLTNAHAIEERREHQVHIKTHLMHVCKL